MFLVYERSGRRDTLIPITSAEAARKAVVKQKTKTQSLTAKPPQFDTAKPPKADRRNSSVLAVADTQRTFDRAIFW